MYEYGRTLLVKRRSEVEDAWSSSPVPLINNACGSIFGMSLLVNLFPMHPGLRVRATEKGPC